MTPSRRIGLALLLTTAIARSALAAYCTTGTELTQDFPSSGTPVSRWHLCWEVLAMPDAAGNLLASETLVITQAEFRPGAAATPVMVLGDVRMSEIFVPYHAGEPRFHDLTEFGFELQPLTSVECPATRLGGDKLCREVRDRGLAWRDPFGGIARRGETLVLWSVLNAGNYDYVMQYEFSDDGTIDVRAAATGQKLEGPDDTAGHMHNFAWRVNLDVAGPGGDTVDVMTTKVGSSSVKESEKSVTTESGIKWDARTFTHVEVTDATRVNGRGRATGYTLSPIREGLARFREPWTKYPIWVTANHGPAAELRAFDLPSYLDREPVAASDVVLWYFDSHSHENDMRDEDRDTVPAAWLGFRLEPQNVWDGTPFYP